LAEWLQKESKWRSEAITVDNAMQHLQQENNRLTKNLQMKEKELEEEKIITTKYVSEKNTFVEK
jgi:hypothetical protein